MLRVERGDVLLLVIELPLDLLETLADGAQQLGLLLLPLRVVVPPPEDRVVDCVLLGVLLLAARLARDHLCVMSE